MAFPDIIIGSKFDAKGFKEAETGFKRLEKGVKKLGAVIGISLSAEAIYQFGKASVKAFMADEKAAAQLSNTVKNLGLALSNADIQSFTNNLSLATGVSKEQLIPSMQKLLQVTGSVTESQKLLKNAIDISKGSGVDLTTVTSDLSNAFVGNTKGLKKYALGLTQAELKTMSFNQVMAAFNKNFSGATQAYLETTAGRLDVISNAAKEASVQVGGALVDAFMTLTGSVNTQDLVSNIDKATEALINFIDRFALSAALIKAIAPKGLLEFAFGSPDKDKVKRDIAAAWKDFNDKKLRRSQATAWVGIDTPAKTAAQKKAEEDAKKRAKAIADAQNANTKALQKQTAIKKESAIFDMQHIELIAALKGQLSDDDRKRAELQLALLDENTTAADTLTKQILMAQDSTGKLYQYFLQTPDAKNPFAYLDQWIKDFQTKLNNLQIPNFTLGTASNGTPALTTGVTGGGTTTTSMFPQTFLGGIALPATNASSGLPSDNAISYNQQTGLSYNPNAVQITVSATDELSRAIANSLQVNSLSGIPSSVQRLVSTFG
jgi:hypothetical protein